MRRDMVPVLECRLSRQEAHPVAQLDHRVEMWRTVGVGLPRDCEELHAAGDILAAWPTPSRGLHGGIECVLQHLADLLTAEAADIAVRGDTGSGRQDTGEGHQVDALVQLRLWPEGGQQLGIEW